MINGIQLMKIRELTKDRYPWCYQRSQKLCLLLMGIVLCTCENAAIFYLLVNYQAILEGDKSE